MLFDRALEKRGRDVATTVTIFAPTGWKTPLLQSITSLPFGTTLLITVKYGTKDERGWTETQPQSQSVYEKPSNTAIFELIYCELRVFAIQHIVKYLNNWCNKLKKKKITSGMSCILHRKSTWKYRLNSLFWFIPPGMKVQHSTSACCCSEVN